LKHGVECIEGFIGQISFSVDFDQVREESGSNGLGFRFETTEEIVEERKVFGATEFENENEVCGVIVTEIGLKRSVVEDLFGEKRVGLGSNEFLYSGWRTN
jgi:hypothetical protein